MSSYRVTYMREGLVKGSFHKLTQSVQATSRFTARDYIKSNVKGEVHILDVVKA